MPKIQTYVNNNVYEQITDLVSIRKQEGIEEASLSNVSSMLLELGLRVYMIQQEKKEGGFNQMEYNKLMLENVSRVRAMCTEILKISILSQEAIASGNFDYTVIKPAIDKFSREQVSIFFPDDDDSQE
ncbi:conjugal transfer relaxosome DNA-binding protein TraM [Citrobacter freundii]|uniref:conjugal transfer relaxosome DNA-binding protein TraM n=1 Tax=Enterobacteriaceae TaxID=543 RepID=UPI002112D21F|nr:MULTISPECIES: conjugal transfer relaxosome DNA-binding protein TraM [Enterobacteriaceae]MEB0921994.1 conjugal transfer relaxosome DNA-binding protein TraM [Citrobacter freundii]UUC36468.1 relaxosome protein TraM [Escherichia coli]UVV98489.1 relaxosome protein TraM [Citrobacter freundii]WIJ19974.1 conjugal transfer relaxosome DNA-binding protein TraM [Citrobacter freundii]WOQ06970.1 conjugal transfer relaxosome DNA-binding protein TraM [Citrobacter freundii]